MTDTRLTAEQAATMLGYERVKTFENLVSRGKLPITVYKASFKAKKFYSKNDIEIWFQKTARVKKTA